MKKIKNVVMIFVFVCSMVIGLGIANPVLAEEKTNIFESDDNKISVTVDEELDENNLLGITLKFDEGVDNIRVYNQDDEELISSDENTYRYHSVVGEDNNYKFTIYYSYETTITNENEEEEAIFREYRFDVSGQINIHQVIEEDETDNSNEDIEIIVNEEYTEEEIIDISTFDTPSLFASGTLNVPNGFQAEFRIDSYSGGWVGTSYSWGIAYVGGQVATCLDPTTQAGHGNVYTSSTFFDGLPSSQKSTIWLINYFGYGFEGDTSVERYLAMQELTWEQMTIEQLRGYGGNEKFAISWTGAYGENITKINQYKAEIQSLMSTYYTRPSFHNITQKVKVGETYTFTDTNGVLARFNVTIGNGLSIVSKSGNVLKVKVTDKNFNPTISLTKKYQPSATNTVSWGASGYQTLFTAGKDRHDSLNSRITLELSSAETKFRKVDEDTGVGLAGATIRASYSNAVDSNGLLINGWDFVTGADGWTVVDTWQNIGSKVYVQEHTPPNGYDHNKTIYEITLVAGEVHEVVINDKKLGDFELKKISNIDGVMANVVYEYKINNTGNWQTKTTNAQGIAGWYGLPHGTQITYREKTGWTDHEVDTTEYTVTILSGQVVTQTRTNIKKANLKLNKDNNFGELLANVEFEFSYNADMSNPFATRSTNSLGVINLVNLTPAVKVYFRETSIPVGHVDNTNKIYSVDLVSGQTSTYTVENIAIEGEAILIKTGDGRLLKNVPFKLFKADGTFIKNINSDENGMVKTGKLRYGDYYLEEVKGLFGFFTDKTKQHFSIKEHEQVLYLYMDNEPVELNLLINKKDGELLTPMANVEFYIKETVSGNTVSIQFIQDGELVTKSSWTTNENGRILLERKLPAVVGGYDLYEVTPYGYLENAPIHFDIHEDVDYIYIEGIGNTIVLEVENDPIIADVLLEKLVKKLGCHFKQNLKCIEMVSM